jgi:hypothetical protein
VSFKYFLLINHSYIKAQIYVSASWYSAESILFNSLSPGVMRGHDSVKHLYIYFSWENLWKSLQDTMYWALQGDLMAIKKSNFACVNLYVKIRKISKLWLRRAMWPFVQNSNKKKKNIYVHIKMIAFVFASSKNLNRLYFIWSFHTKIISKQKFILHYKNEVIGWCTFYKKFLRW